MTPQEITSQIFDEKEKVRRELREELRDQFKAEKENLTERFQLMVQGARWVLLALVAIIGFFGWRGGDDIRKSVEDHFKSDLAKRYELDDRASPLNASVEQLIDRAVVNALYLEASRIAHDSARFGVQFGRNEPTPLTTAEFERLVRIAKSGTTDAARFADVIYILVSVLRMKSNARQCQICLLKCWLPDRHRRTGG